MKNKLKILLVIALLSILGFLGFKVVSKFNHKKEITERIKTIPNFTFHTLDGNKFTRDSLQNKPIVFIYFNSEFDYCQSEAIKIRNSMTEFENIQLLFISFEELEIIKKFRQEYKLMDFDNVIFLEDRKGKFSEIFDVNSIPYIVIYDANQKLLKKFKGATGVSKIIEAINNKE